jgi:sulfocyanin
MNGRGTMCAMAALVMGCGEAESNDAQRSLAEARADSSAAGYTTGGASAGPAAARPAADSQRSATAPPRAPGRVPPESRPRAGKTGPAMPRRTGPSDSASRAVAGQPATPARDTGVDGTRAPERRGSAATTPVRVNEFLAYTPASQSVQLQVIAGVTGANEGLEFNGGFAGAQSVTVPLGWRVTVTFVNRDADLAHSVVVIPDIDPVPDDIPEAAFPGAATSQAREGLAQNNSDEMTFTASRAGRYLVVCGVPGHAQGGQWLSLIVSPTAPEPSYRR